MRKEAAWSGACGEVRMEDQTMATLAALNIVCRCGRDMAEVGVVCVGTARRGEEGGREGSEAGRGSHVDTR